MTANRNQLSVELQPGLSLIHVDAMRLRQVLLILLSNAAKFTRDGQVRLRARRQHGEVEFEVEDTGIGLSPEQIAGALPALRAGRRRHHAVLRRQRPGPGDRPPPVAPDGRRHQRDQRAGPGLVLPGAPARGPAPWRRSRMNSRLPTGEPWCERLACPAEPARLPELMALARRACAEVDAPAQVEHDLLLLTEEACINVMRHAYPDSAPGSIALQVRVVQPWRQDSHRAHHRRPGPAFRPTGKTGGGCGRCRRGPRRRRPGRAPDPQACRQPGLPARPAARQRLHDQEVPACYD